MSEPIAASITAGAKSEQVKQCVPEICPDAALWTEGSDSDYLQVPREHGSADTDAGAHTNVHSRTRGPNLLACSGKKLGGKAPSIACAYLCLHLVVTDHTRCTQWLVENHPTRPAKAEWHEVRDAQDRDLVCCCA